MSDSRMTINTVADAKLFSLTRKDILRLVGKLIKDCSVDLSPLLVLRF